MIGGEPTLHPQYKKLISILVERDDINDVTIFTNGIKIDETIELYTNKFNFLINLNSPHIIGKSNYSRIIKNIELIIGKLGKHSVTLGINIYQVRQNYQFFIEALNKFKLDNARLSIAVANNIHGDEAIERLIAFKQIGYQLYIDLLYNGIRPIFDCNKFPMCVWTETEKRKIRLIQQNMDNKRAQIDLNTCKCRPVIDILPDLTAIRCFGLSMHNKVSISEFNSYDDLREYFYNIFDIPLGKVATSLRCEICEFFTSGNCNSGCYENKEIQ